MSTATLAIAGVRRSSRGEGFWTSFTRLEVLLLAYILLSRIVLIAYVYPDRDRMFNGDSELYEGLAATWLETGRYEYPAFSVDSDLVRPPGYPAFIALNYAVFGRDLLAPVLWNVLATVLVCLQLRWLLRRMGFPHAHLAFAILAADLLWLLYSKDIVTEPIFTVVLLGAFMPFVKGMDAWAEAQPSDSARRRSVAFLAASGGLVAIGALIKPILLYLPVCAAAYLLVRRKPVHALAFTLVFLAGIAPWMLRNYNVHGALTFTSIQNSNLLFAHGAFVYADAHDLTHDEAKSALEEALDRRVGGSYELPYPEQNAALGAQARDVLLDHPLLYAKALLRGAAVTLFDPGRLDVNRTFPTESTEKIGFTNTIAREGLWGTFRLMLRKDPRLVTVLVAYLAFLFVVNGLVALGIRPFFRAAQELFVVVSLLVLYLLVLGGVQGNGRFRLYIYPFLLLYAQFGWRWFRARMAGERHSAPTIRAIQPVEA